MIEWRFGARVELLMPELPEFAGSTPLRTPVPAGVAILMVDRLITTMPRAGTCRVVLFWIPVSCGWRWHGEAGHQRGALTDWAFIWGCLWLADRIELREPRQSCVIVRGYLRGRMPQELLGMEQAEGCGNVGPELRTHCLTRLCDRGSHAAQPFD